MTAADMHTRAYPLFLLIFSFKRVIIYRGVTA